MGASDINEKNGNALALDVEDAQSNDERPKMSAWKAYWVRFINTFTSNHY
jgi:hypothetical protein